MNKGQLIEFIQGETYAVLSSINAAGKPESALVGIAVTAELELIFDSMKTTRKYANLCARPAVSFVVGCSGDQTLQFEGIAAELTGDELRRYKPVYFAKFKDGPSRENGPAICYFAVKPKWIRFSDYGETPPLVTEFEF